MSIKYNLGYQLVSKDYNEERYVILKRFDTRGSYIYKVKNEVEANSLAPMLELICSNDMQVILTNKPDIYAEYKPYTKVSDLKTFINIAINS